MGLAALSGHRHMDIQKRKSLAEIRHKMHRLYKGTTVVLRVEAPWQCIWVTAGLLEVSGPGTIPEVCLSPSIGNEVPSA